MRECCCLLLWPTNYEICALQGLFGGQYRINNMTLKIPRRRQMPGIISNVVAVPPGEVYPIIARVIALAQDDIERQLL